MPNNEEKKDSQAIGSGLTRRKMLQLSAAAGVASIVGSRRALAMMPTSATLSSPPTTPFLQSLPIQWAASPRFFLTRGANLVTASGVTPPQASQKLPHSFYDVTIKPSLHTFHPDLGQTYVWGYNRQSLGPVFVAGQKAPIIVRFRVDSGLPVDQTAFGTSTTIAQSGHIFGPGLAPGVTAGFNELPPVADLPEVVQTLWGMDGSNKLIAANNYRGINSMYVLYDRFDTGFEMNIRKTAFLLPGPFGTYEVPLVFSDKIFGSSAQLASAIGAPGDKFVVNGAIQPFFQVSRRKYRLRLFNTGPSRAFEVSLSNSANFTVLGKNGTFLQSPLAVSQVQLEVGARSEVIVDFSGTNLGDKIYLLSNLQQNVGKPASGPVPPVPLENVLLRFDVVGDAPDLSQIPASLSSSASAHPVWNFDLVKEPFDVGGLTIAPDSTRHEWVVYGYPVA